jgi:hypothetical protein
MLWRQRQRPLLADASRQSCSLASPLPARLAAVALGTDDTDPDHEQGKWSLSMLFRWETSDIWRASGRQTDRNETGILANCLDCPGQLVEDGAHVRADYGHQPELRFGPLAAAAMALVLTTEGR